MRASGKKIAPVAGGSAQVAPKSAARPTRPSGKIQRWSGLALTKLSVGSDELAAFPSLQLPSLELLQIENCHQLKKLDLKPAKLPNLKQLILDHCPAIPGATLDALRAAFGKKLKVTNS